MSDSYGFGTPDTSAWTGPPRKMLQKTVWRYIDFLKLYRGISDADYREFHTTVENSDGSMIEQSVIDLRDEVTREAKARGMKPKDVMVEFEARAAAARLPSATGVAPARVAGSGFGAEGQDGFDGRFLVGLALVAVLAGRKIASRFGNR